MGLSKIKASNPFNGGRNSTNGSASVSSDAIPTTCWYVSAEARARATMRASTILEGVATVHTDCTASNDVASIIMGKLGGERGERPMGKQEGQ